MSDVMGYVQHQRVNGKIITFLDSGTGFGGGDRITVDKQGYNRLSVGIR